MAHLVRASLLEGFEDFVRQLGADPAPLLKEANFSPALLSESEAILPSITYVNLLERAAEVTECEHFGLLYAKSRNLQPFLGIVGMLMHASPNFGAAVKKWIDHVGIARQGALWRLHVDQQVTYLERLYELDVKSTARQSIELAIATCWRTMRLISGNRWHPSMVCLAFEHPLDTLPYRRLFNVPIRFEADFNGIVFHTADLKLPLPKHDDELYSTLEKFAYIQDLPKPRDFKKEVKRLIANNLDTGVCDITSVVQFFPHERRTLQRKLSAEGTSYHKLLNEVRDERALDYLQNTNISLTQLADKLCYADLSAFTKAFKKRIGQSPQSWRNLHRSKAT